MRTLLEASRQTIPPFEPAVRPIVIDRPLFELAALAPPLPSEAEYDISKVEWPVSNDDTAPYFEQTLARTAQPDYQEA